MSQGRRCRARLLRRKAGVVMRECMLGCELGGEVVAVHRLRARARRGVAGMQQVALPSASPRERVHARTRRATRDGLTRDTGTRESVGTARAQDGAARDGAARDGAQPLARL